MYSLKDVTPTDKQIRNQITRLKVELELWEGMLELNDEAREKVITYMIGLSQIREYRRDGGGEGR